MTQSICITWIWFDFLVNFALNKKHTLNLIEQSLLTFSLCCRNANVHRTHHLSETKKTQFPVEFLSIRVGFSKKFDGNNSETNRLCSMFLLGCALLWCDPTTMPYERGKWMTDANTTTTPRDECSMYLRWKSLQDVNWHFYRGRNNKFNRAKYGAVWFQFFFCFALHNRSSSNSWIRFLRWNFFYFFSAFFFSGEFFSYEFFSTMIRFF